jgi:hypothetical protein
LFLLKPSVPQYLAHTFSDELDFEDLFSIVAGFSPRWAGPKESVHRMFLKNLFTEN